MNIHEYQAKRLLSRYGCARADFTVISNLTEVDELLNKSPSFPMILKVQVHAGGRGKAGGVRLAKTPQELVDAARDLLGMKIVNAQTGPKGLVAGKVMIAPVVDVKKESYLSLAIDRSRAKIVLMASPYGGMEIEEIAERHPEKLLLLCLPSSLKLRQYQLLRLMKFMGWNGKVAEQGKALIQGLVQAFLDNDALLLEVNPLVETEEGDLVALDAKMSIDDNALFRQKAFLVEQDLSQLAHEEVEAKQYDLSYVALDGQIGCMVNGAGLAMATVDIIHLFGGAAANFLDVGGSATEEKIAAGLRIILSDHKVKAILINIFGGIMNCDTLAKGIIQAAQQEEISIPLILRMEGTAVEAAKERLACSNLKVIVADSLGDAAEKAVIAAQDSRR